MNKKNKILVGCLALLLVLSVGYALFSETITINGTATAKGSFDITATCTPGYNKELLAFGIPDIDYMQNGFDNSVCDIKDSVVVATTDLLYPLASRTFTVKMTNTGSIPALIWGSSSGDLEETLDSDQSASWALKNKESNEIIKSGSGDSINNIYDFFFADGAIVISSDGVLFADKNVIYDNERGYAGIKLNPGDSVYTSLRFEYPKNATDLMSDNGNSEYYEFKLNHEYKWEQYIDSPNYESTTFDKWCFDGC